MIGTGLHEEPMVVSLAASAIAIGIGVALIALGRKIWP